MEIAGAVDDEHIENTAAAVARCIADELALADEVADILFILAEIAVHGHDGILAVGHGGGIGLAAAGVFFPALIPFRSIQQITARKERIQFQSSEVAHSLYSCAFHFH